MQLGDSMSYAIWNVNAVGARCAMDALRPRLGLTFGVLTPRWVIETALDALG
jgi:hypothetical protein